MKKKKTYVLTLSKHFLANHKRAGEEIYFKEKPLLGQGLTNYDASPLAELHTIRVNYPLWKKRFEQIAAGKACLSIRQWVGKPYGKGSTQREIVRLTREDGIGIQELRIVKEKLNSRPIYLGYVDGKQGDFNFFQELAANDGLSFNDWFDWFEGYNLSQPMAIIHFTPFRY